MTSTPRTRIRRAGAALAALVVGGALAVAPGKVDASDQIDFPVQLVRVHTPTWRDRDRLTNLGLDLTEHGGPDYVEVVLHVPADAARLDDAGFDWTVEVADLAAQDAANRRADAEYAAATAVSPLPSGRDTYRTLEDYEADMSRLGDHHPDLVRVITLPHTSVEGRPIRGVEISEHVESKRDGKPTFLMMGLHHAREWPSGENAMEFAFDLVRNYGKDPRITSLLQRLRVIVVPVVNPDGFEQSRKWGDIVDLRESGDENVTILGTPGNAYKRKNCRPFDGGDAVPGLCESTSPGGYGLGVDLNRNYGGYWGGAGASDVPADPTYRGPGPFSEPETQAVRELISSRQVTTLITNHTFSNLVLRPPGVRAAGETIDEGAMKRLGARMAAQNGYRNIHGWQLYDTTGTTEDWSYSATGGYGYTFEIGPDEFHPPYEDVVDQYLGTGFYEGKGNREAYLIAAEAAANPKHHAVLTGKAPRGAVLRLKKSFATRTSQKDEYGKPVVFSDTLRSKLVASGRPFSWHVNPSTRPEVMEHRVRLLAEEPTREETIDQTAVWAPGDHIDVPFSLPETGVGALDVALDWPTPDDLDLEIYYVQPDDSLLEVGSSGNAPGEKEAALIELPEVGEYVFRVINFASATPSFTITAGLFDHVGEKVFGDDLVESYTVRCEDSDGNVLQKLSVVVDRGETEKLDLGTCARKLARKD